MIPDRPEDAAVEVLVRRALTETGFRSTSMLRARASAAIGTLCANEKTDAAALLERIDRGEPVLHRLIDAILIGETYFFRDPALMDWLSREIIPGLSAASGRLPLRVWSAGCASGEEPYSLAVRGIQVGAQMEVVGTDISAAAIEQARIGSYRPWAVRGADPDLLGRFFHQRADRFEPVREVRDRVSFEVGNLLDGRSPFAAPAHLILCRNVLMYLDLATAVRVARGLLACLDPAGWLILGPSDPLLPLDAGRRVVDPRAGFAYRPQVSAASDTPPDPPSRLAPSGAVEASRLAYSSRNTTSGRKRPQAQSRPGRPPPVIPDPTSTDAVGPRAEEIRTLADRGRLTEAETALGEALELSPLEPELWLLAALVALARGKVAEAIAHCRRALYLDPGFVMARLTLAVALLRVGNRVGANHERSLGLRALKAMPADAVVRGSGGESAAVVAARIEAENSLPLVEGRAT